MGPRCEYATVRRHKIPITVLSLIHRNTEKYKFVWQSYKFVIADSKLKQTIEKCCCNAYSRDATMNQLINKLIDRKLICLFQSFFKQNV